MISVSSSVLRLLRRLALVVAAAAAPFYWVAPARAPDTDLAVPSPVHGVPDPAPPGTLGITLDAESTEIRYVMEGSSAARAGLLAGDRVLMVNGVEFEDSRRLRELLAVRRAGERVVVRVSRDGQLFETTLTMQPVGRRRGHRFDAR